MFHPWNRQNSRLWDSSWIITKRYERLRSSTCENRSGIHNQFDQRELKGSCRSFLSKEKPWCSTSQRNCRIHAINKSSRKTRRNSIFKQVFVTLINNQLKVFWENILIPFFSQIREITIKINKIKKCYNH